ncbi:MAG: hypothetical protein KZQ59_01405, partial [Candidatus Thiodiazotropha sp. (ex Lucinoma aequizonata)]|nr:hypothetical protein [Candidatus Thiodiazotropha sp. (ex Lucinoma aequizonata)]MCU7912103.1 hypothetical protein [Candidatus Thiodiazotropha sp. (ex Lucinoma aequizonata)]
LSRDGMLHMMFKLGLCAEKKWRRFRGLDYLAKVVTGFKCINTRFDNNSMSIGPRQTIRHHCPAFLLPYKHSQPPIWLSSPVTDHYYRKI